MMGGTASHMHISISSPNGKEKKIYESFYAGVLKHLRAIAAFTYSSPASYDRVVDGCWAGGRYIGWGSQNRETPLRKIEGSHWEVKCLDGLANMYLAVSAVLAAGTKGVIDGEVMRWKDCEVDPAALTVRERGEFGIEEMFPANLGEAMDALVGDSELVNLLGKEVVERYVAVKKAEAAQLNGMSAGVMRDWLIDRY